MQSFGMSPASRQGNQATPSRQPVELDLSEARLHERRRQPAKDPRHVLTDAWLRARQYRCDCHKCDSGVAGCVIVFTENAFWPRVSVGNGNPGLDR